MTFRSCLLILGMKKPPKSGVRRRRRITKKLVKAATARTTKGGLNYTVDTVFDEGLKSPYADELAHFMVEMGLGPGTNQKKLLRWASEFAKYRLGG